MSTSIIVGIVIVVVAVAVIVAAMARIQAKRRELQERYGDEYHRVVAEKGGRSAAEAELRQRDRRHAELNLTELTPEQREQYRLAWNELQTQFVDDPATAVHGADQLVSRLVADRGYPVSEFDDRLSHLSVEHSAVLQHYRDAHEVSVRNDAGTASTEDLRKALVDYRELATALLGDDPAGHGASAAPATPADNPAPATPADNPAPATPADNPAPATPAVSPAPTALADDTAATDETTAADADEVPLRDRDADLDPAGARTPAPRTGPDSRDDGTDPVTEGTEADDPDAAALDGDDRHAFDTETTGAAAETARETGTVRRS